MRARATRFMAVSQATLLLASLILPALVAATEITTDLWVYQYGDTVTVTGVDFGADEAVEVVTTDPSGIEVDRGSAQTNAGGGFTYAFVLLSDVPGIYDVVATGATSGFTASTQFDPPGTPGNLRFIDSRAVDGNITLTWGASSGNPNCYRVFRASTSMAAKVNNSAQTSCTAAATNLVTDVTTTTFTEARGAGAWFYYVTAVRNSGGGAGESDSSNQVTTRDMEGSLPSAFGSVNVGTSSAPSAFTVTNNSGATITVRTPTIAGSNPGDFAVSGLSPAAGSTVANGASFSFNVTFTPGAVGARSANVQINVSDAGALSVNNTRVAPVSGTGIDTTAPSVAAFTCAPAPGSTNATTLNCSVTFSESVTGFNPSTSDLAIGGTSTTWTSGAAVGSGAGPYTFTVSRGAPTADGSLTLQVAAGAAQDGSANASTASSVLSYTIDATAPTVTSFSCAPAPGLTNATSLSCSVTFNESVTGFVANSSDVTIGGTSTTWSAGTTAGSGAGPYTFNVSRGGPNSDGSLTVRVAAGAAIDATSNGSAASATLSYTIDTSGPGAPSFTSTPANPTNSQNASFTFTTPTDPTVNGVTSGINRLECQLDGSGFATCTSPVAYSTLAAGSHTFQVRAIDNVGNVGANATYTWVIDLTSPTVTSFSCAPAASPTTSTSFNCSASFSESVTGFNPTTSDLTIGGTSTTWGASGLAGSGAGPYTFTVSRSAPNTDGTLTLQIASGAVQDLAGNASAVASAQLSWTVDISGPTVDLSCTPLGGSPTNATTIACQALFNEPVTGFSSTTADLIIGGTSPSSIDWDPGASTGSGAGPYFFTVTRTSPNKDGNLTFQIAAGAVQDGLGNTSAASNTLTFLIDTTPPTVAINSSPSNPSNSSSASFAFSATDPTNGSANGVNSGIASTECQLDGSGFGACTSPATYSGLGLGSHTFQVRATDNAGNVGTPTSFTWTIVAPDTAPSITSTSPANGATGVSLTATITLNFSEPVTMTGSPQVSCATSGLHTFTKSGDGTASVSFAPATPPSYAGGETCNVTVTASTVHDVDANDPPDTLAANYLFSFTVLNPNTPPVLTVPASPVLAEATSPAGAAVTFSVTATDAEDNPDPTPTCDHNSGDTFPIGDTTVNCSVTDSGGLSDSDSFIVRVQDTTDPTVDITTAESHNGFGWFNIASNDLVAGVTVDVATSDAVGVTSLTCTVNAVSVGALDPSGDSFVLGDGEHFVQCTALDGAGNDASDSAPFSVDQTAPSIDIDHTADGSNGWNVTDPVTESIVASDATSGVDSVACLDGADPLAVTFDDPDYSASVTGDGTHDLSCTATDVAGNTNSDTDQVKIDTVDPTIDISHIADGDNGWNRTSPVAESIETTGGAASVACLDGASPLATTGASPTWSASVSGQGVHALSCTATDAAGNTSAADTDTVKIDTVAPTFTHTLTPASPAATGWYNIATGAPAMAFSCSDGTSGLAAACPGNFTFGNGASQSHSETIYDNAGNSSSQSESGINVDLIAPSISAALSPDADAVTGWWNIATGAPTVTYTCADTGSSGLASCTSPHLFGEGENQTHSGTATDVAGNSNTAGVSNVDVDLTAPSISAAVTPARPGPGWWNIASGAPTVAYTCLDTDGSGVASCLAGHGELDNTYAFGEGENQVDSGTATDVAGNTNTAGVSNIDVDLTAPTLSVTIDDTPNGAGWFKTTVHFTTHGLDNLSGIASCGDAADYSGPDGNPVTSAAVTCTDVAGNLSDSATSPSFKYDATKPVATVNIDDTPNLAGWFKTTVHFTTSGTDNLSGVASCTDAADYSGPDSATATSASATCADAAGNVSNTDVSDAFKYDATAPTVTVAVSSGTAGAHGWYISPVGVDTSGADLTSGVLDSNCTADQTQAVNTTTSGVDFNGQCTDNAGNVGYGGPLNVKVDLTNPSVAITSHPTGYVTVAPSLAMAGTASDTPSGIEKVNVNGGPNAVYSAGTWSASVNLVCGVNTITAVATDMAGRTSSTSISITRVCTGTLTYYQPIDQSTTTPIINTGKMGKVIPVKVTGSFNPGSGSVALTEANLATYGLTLRIGVNSASCAGSATDDLIEAYADAGAANDNTNMFRWSTSQWIYNLDTSKAPNMNMQINQCYRLDVYLQDAHNVKVLVSTGPSGTNPYALFKPTK
jgi:large repetitive protein